MQVDRTLAQSAHCMLLLLLLLHFLLQMGVPERLALLTTRDTSARLHYILAAIQPHLQELRARVSVKNAIGAE